MSNAGYYNSNSYGAPQRPPSASYAGSGQPRIPSGGSGQYAGVGVGGPMAQGGRSGSQGSGTMPYGVRPGQSVQPGYQPAYPPASGAGQLAPGGPGPTAPPAPSEAQLHQWFTAVDKNGSGHITQIELQQALVNGDWSHFSADTIKMLMNIFDTDRTGTINFREFIGLWNYIRDWQDVFRLFDLDRSGTIEARELGIALQRFGYNLSPQLLQRLLLKYGQLQGEPGQRTRGISFDRFVCCCVTVRQLTESFRAADNDQDGWVQMSYDQFMTIVSERARAK